MDVFCMISIQTTIPSHTYIRSQNSAQGGHGTGKTGNLDFNFSRQGKHREFGQFNFLHKENCGKMGKILNIQQGVKFPTF